jgi:hippurate hydrolase
MQQTSELVAWRRDLHAHPETAFEEHRTASLVAERLASFGWQVATGVGRTGVVGTLSAGTGERAIGLRADMDALHMTEACGHDGHTTMLLGAARYLAETKNFSGTVRVIFQPAEENEGGGRVMVEDGLFERFPVDAVYGLHNWPGLPVGHLAVADGPMMASFDVFEIAVRGRGAHAAMPHLGADAIVAAAAMVTALQTVVSRATDPLDAAVVSVTQIHGGDTWNVLPEEVVLRGTTRSLSPTVQEATEAAMARVVEGIASAHGVEASLRVERRYPPTVNTKREALLAAEVAFELLGRDAVSRDLRPSMGGEDFAFMLQKKPGAYAWLGAGTGAQTKNLHNPSYDFNDELLALGASYWVKLTERALPRP